MVSLARAGIAGAPGLTREEAGAVAVHLVAAPCYPGHVRVYGDGQPRHHGSADLGPVFCHSMADVLAAPHFWELVLRSFPTAAEYLEVVAPRLYSVNAFWSRPGSEPIRDLQTWHRDRDDDRFVTLFVYGTDVLRREAGPHRFRAGTQNGAEEGDLVTIYGHAGTAFLADTRGLHYGEAPREGCRLLLWARWGVSERPASYVWDRLEPVPAAVLGDRLPADAALRRAVELVVG